jgi:hypothetical protein
MTQEKFKRIIKKIEDKKPVKIRTSMYVIEPLYKEIKKQLGKKEDFKSFPEFLRSYMVAYLVSKDVDVESLID